MSQGKVQRGLLDAIFRTVYVNDPEKLAAWVSASHVERDPHHPAAPAPTPATTTAK